MIEGLKEIEGFVHSLLRAFRGVVEQEQIIEYKGTKIRVTIEVLEKCHIEDLKLNDRAVKTEKLLDEIKNGESLCADCKHPERHHEPYKLYCRECAIRGHYCQQYKGEIKEEETKPVLCMMSHPMHGRWTCDLLLGHSGDCMVKIAEEITWERSK